MKGAHKRKFKRERHAGAARKAVMGMIWHEDLGWLTAHTYERVVQIEGLVRRITGKQTAMEFQR